MEQSKINVIIIAGIIIAGAGAWAGPIMTAQTANEFFDDLSEVQTAQVGFYQGQGFNFDEFGLGAVKDEIYFFDHDDQFALDVQFGGPLLDLFSFKQELIPADLIGITLPTAGVNTFGAATTIIEMRVCDFTEANIGATTSRFLDECQPAIVDKVFINATNGNVDPNAIFRVQLAICEDFNMINHFDEAADVVPTDDICEGDSDTNTGDDFEDAIIILDLIVQPGDGTDSLETIIIDGGAIPSFQGSTLMARAADDTGGAGQSTVNIWVGLKRVGDEGAFEFVNPGLFGGDFVDGCVAFQIEQGGAAQNNVGIFLEVFGIPFFNTTNAQGHAMFNNVPLGFFSIIDIELTNSVIFLDQILTSGSTNNEAGFTVNTNCFEIDFDIDNAPQF